MRRYSRQHVLYVAILVAAADLPTGTFVPIVQLPGKAVEHDGFIDVTEAFDGVTSDVVTVGTEAAPTGYLAATNVKATGRTALTVAEGVSSEKKTIGITRTAVGGNADATGELLFSFAYTQVGRHVENFGELDGGVVGS